MPSCDGLINSKAVDFLLRALLAPFALARLRRCDVLLVQSHFLPDVLPAIAFGGRNAVVQIWHVQDAPWERPGSLVNNILAYANERAGLALVRLAFGTIIAGSHLAAKQITGLSGKALFITTNGVQHIGPAAAGSLRDGALYVGRLHPTKGIDDLIDAWRTVMRSCGGRRLFIAGDGEPAYRAAIETKIDSAGLRGWVFLLGRVSDERKRELLSTARVFVFPSYEEGWGIALAEAMAAGVPCVTYDLQIFDEIFPRGRLAAPLGRIAALAEQVCKLILDDALHGRLAGEAQRLAETFTWQRAANVEAQALLSLPAAKRYEAVPKHTPGTT